jgi:hypothetical protein
MLLSVPVCAAENLTVINQSELKSTQQQGVYPNDSENSSLPTFTIDPVADHYIGDSFVLHGVANLSLGEEILLMISPETHYHSALRPKFSKIRELSTTLQVWSGKNSSMEWTYPIYTGDWAADTYVINVVPVSPKYGDLNATARFNLTERPRPTSSVPTGNTTTAPVPVKNTSAESTTATVNPPVEVPTTHQAPVPLAVSITGIGVGIITIRRFRKN